MRGLKLLFCFVFVVGASGEAKQEGSLISQLPKNDTEDASESTTISWAPHLRFHMPCETPNGDVGICIEIKKCKVLMQVLFKAGSKKFLLESKCNSPSTSSGPSVCCGKYGHFVKDKSKLSQTEAPLPVPESEIGYRDNSFSTNYTERHTDAEVLEDATNPLPKKCGIQMPLVSSRIMGGTVAGIGEFPWLARLIHVNHNGYRTYGCSGYLISPSFVLTAAHCIISPTNSVKGNISSVIFGEHNTKTEVDCLKSNPKLCAPPPVEIRVKSLVFHPEFTLGDNSYPNDIGIIYLKNPVTFTDFIQPICLLDKPNYIVYQYQLSGWGKTDAAEISNVKMKVDVPSYDHQSCREKFQALELTVTDKQICAGGVKGKDSCTGDSGGPLMMTPNGTVWYAAGLVSYGLGCAREGWPGVYTSIPHYVPWIKSEIRKMVQSKSSRKAR
ncbi:CLIP domain-containing serine protease B9 [Aethina tumida]|uniref:CLIP domain-containing serine protease B9 n=1 Tax=Aethina tumida TaxID=116153 RepID=UPI00096B4C74|nr:CLIP domain-containing serine protease B9 [Aethina tumida]